MATIKTAVSMEKGLFRQADKTAKNMGISRSQLISRAVRGFLGKQAEAKITEKLNEVYGHSANDDDADFLDSAAADLAENGHWKW